MHFVLGPICIAVILGFAAVEAKNPIVNTHNGPVMGFDFLTDNGRMAEIYLGIPFAKPPLDDLRFEKPVPATKWSGVLNATKFAPPCAVHDPIFAADSSEDCLYLSVMRPKWKSRNPKGFPILVWIHGGSFLMGGAEQYGYKTAADNFIPQGVIFISIQYRLGPWGFFSSGDSQIPGNLGLWDQIMALREIQKLAKDFGGDASRVTIMGQSAGSGSVSWLSMAPVANNLFSQVIELSGSVYSAWVRSDDVIAESLKLAEQLGCPNGKDMKKCLKKLDLKSFQKTMRGNYGIFRQNINFAYFNPRMDGELVKAANFDDAIRKAPKRPTMMGVTSQESLLWSFEHIGILPEDEIYHLSEERVEVYSRDDLADFIRTNIAIRAGFGASAKSAAEEIISHYADCEAPKNPDNIFYFERFTQLLSDLQFNIPMVREARMKALAGYPVYFQKYSYQKSREVTEYPIDGSPHGAELAQLFSAFFYASFEDTPDDPIVRNILVDRISAFVHRGNPATKALAAPRVTKTNFPYAEINVKTKIGHNPFFKNYLFWERLGKKYGYDVSKGIKIKRVTKAPQPVRRNIKARAAGPNGIILRPARTAVSNGIIQQPARAAGPNGIILRPAQS
uniref:Carboxylic ester hydrolase n=1 Tax=Panagrellus redivivus TaxID=6233 RepID=A0A7E4VR61_PANRE